MKEDVLSFPKLPTDPKSLKIRRSYVDLKISQKNIFFRKYFWDEKCPHTFSLKILEKIEIFEIFRFFSFFNFSKISIFLRIFNENVCGNFSSQKIFSEKLFFCEIFQIDITSSDLNEFLIGWKFWKAESLLYSDPEGELVKLISLRERPN